MIEGARGRYKEYCKSVVFKRLKLLKSRYANCSRSIKHHMEMLETYKFRMTKIEPELNKLKEQWKIERGKG